MLFLVTASMYLMSCAMLPLQALSDSSDASVYVREARDGIVHHGINEHALHREVERDEQRDEGRRGAAEHRCPHEQCGIPHAALESDFVRVIALLAPCLACV